LRVASENVFSEKVELLQNQLVALQLKDLLWEELPFHVEKHAVESWLPEQRVDPFLRLAILPCLRNAPGQV